MVSMGVGGWLGFRYWGPSTWTSVDQGTTRSVWLGNWRFGVFFVYAQAESK